MDSDSGPLSVYAASWNTLSPPKDLNASVAALLFNPVNSICGIVEWKFGLPGQDCKRRAVFACCSLSSMTVFVVILSCLFAARAGSVSSSLNDVSSHSGKTRCDSHLWTYGAFVDGLAAGPGE